MQGLCEKNNTDVVVPLALFIVHSGWTDPSRPFIGGRVHAVERTPNLRPPSHSLTIVCKWVNIPGSVVTMNSHFFDVRTQVDICSSLPYGEPSRQLLKVNVSGVSDGALPAHCWVHSACSERRHHLTCTGDSCGDGPNVRMDSPSESYFHESQSRRC